MTRRGNDKTALGPEEDRNESRVVAARQGRLPWGFGKKDFLRTLSMGLAAPRQNSEDDMKLQPRLAILQVKPRDLLELQLGVCKEKIFG